MLVTLKKTGSHLFPKASLDSKRQVIENETGLMRDSIEPKATRSGSWFCKEHFGEWYLFYHTAISKCHKPGDFDTRMSESMTVRTGVEERTLSELGACKLGTFNGLLVIFGL